MKHKITQRGVFAVSAKTIDERKPEVVALMQRYGMNVNVNDSKDKIDMAFLSLLPRSRGFRKDFAALATPVAESMHKEYKNACGDCYANASSDPMKDIMNIPSKGIGTTKEMAVQYDKVMTGKTGGAPAKSKKAFSDTGFGSWLSGVFDKDTTQNIINTGLGIYAYQKTGGTQGANPLNQGRSDVQGQTPTPPAGEQGSSTGLGTGGIVAIALGALALVGFGIYYATKK